MQAEQAEKEWTYMDTLGEYRKLGDHVIQLDQMFKSMTVEKLEFVSSCLVVGPGSGIPELKFFQRLVPNLKKVVFLEPDKASIKALKESLSTSHISSLEITIELVKAEEWKNEKKEKFDLVLMFHSLYEVRQRPVFLDKCLKNWMNNESALYILMKNDTQDEKGYAELWNEIFKKLGVDRLIKIREIKEDLFKIGRTFEKEYKCSTFKELALISDDMIIVIFYEVNPRPSVEEVRKVIRELRDEGYVGRVPESIISIRNRL